MALRTKEFTPIQGMEKVLKNLNRRANKVFGATLAGLVQGGFLVQREAQKLCPVDWGNLRASAYVMWTKKVFDMSATDRAFIMTKKGLRSKFKPGPAQDRLEAEYDGVLEDARVHVEADLARDITSVEIGFTAYYAIYVHEDLQAQHPGKQAIARMSAAQFRKGLTINADGEMVFSGRGEAKFLQKALEQNATRILMILVKRARIG